MSKKLTAHFKKADPILYQALLKTGGVEKLSTQVPKEYFLALAREIINQQLNGRVAEIIFQRFKNLFIKGNITPAAVLRLPDEKIRGVGMSNAKVKFIKDLAQKVHTDELNFKNLRKLDDEAVIMELTKVEGIGRWTAEMFLMFSLGREDIFSHGDLGLMRAIMKLYKLRKEPSRKKVERIVNKWSPYKTYACRILWRSLEIEGIK